MQEKRNIKLLISFVSLLLATALFYWIQMRPDTTAVDADIFKVTDFNNINKVSLTSAQDTVLLSINDSKWRVNDLYDADRNMIDILFATLQQAVPKRPVASNIQDSLSRHLEENGTKVSLFNGDENLLTFYAGGNSQKSQGYFKLPDGDPYLMAIPGYRVYVSGIFEQPVNVWRDKFVFGFNWRNFQRMEVTVPGRPEESFVVMMEDRFPVIQSLPEVDTARLNQFLDDVSLLTVDNYIDEVPSTLKTAGPRLVINVFDIASRKYELVLRGPLSDEALWVGETGENQNALFSENKIRAINRPKSYFRPQ